MTPEDLFHGLPKGRLVCRAHTLIYCRKCYVDFTFTRAPRLFRRPDDCTHMRSNNLSCLKEVHIFLSQPARTGTVRRRSSRVLPTRFKPPTPNTTPLEVFRADHSRFRFCRYVNRNDSTQGLIFTDGACLDNGRAYAHAGWGRLEIQGPFGDEGAQTSNRAELRAVIAALNFRHWPGEGFKSLVFATDSEYVAEGATEWVKKWLINGWRTSFGAPVKNQDLWEALLGEVERMKEEGLKVQFWRIGREFNTEADLLAKEGAMESAPEVFTRQFGIIC
ncbi:ribonuclease H-like protein [Periconia macrospinosa]|uniref:ribonuclease H n=1 Tax=Periconia macrospinosa TaxID=97972 RepID=A0A2V1E5T3_9PLEO|nr:ribonuclease H-like protein [Periconia macrospinosa]